MDENIFYEIDLTCPVCGYKFKTYKTKVKVKENMPVGYETYLVPIYQNEMTNPLSYDIDVCPNCSYAAYHKDFKENTDSNVINIVKSFFYDIKKLSKETNFNLKDRNYEEARIAYIISAFIYEQMREKDYIKIAKCYIRTAWYSKELKDIDFYRKSLKKALDSYINAYNVIDDFKLSNIILYLIAVIYVELGDFDSAIPYFNKLNGDQKAKKIPEIKEKLEEQTLYMREKIKELNEEMKNMNDDEKKKFKKNRKDAVKVPDFETPFGVELKKTKERSGGEGEITEVIVKDKNEKKPKILITDDSKLLRKTIEKIVEDVCEVVGVAENGKEAIEFIKKYSPDIVTLDIEMPGISGIETLKEIKKIKYDILVIMISSKHDSKTIMEALKNGASNYLLKPIDKEKLLNIIKKG